MAQGGTNFNEVGLSGDPDIDGILWGYRWGNATLSTNLTYSFPTGTAEYVGYEAITGFQAFNAAQQAAINTIAAEFEGVCGLDLTLVTGAGANLRFAEANTIDYSTNTDWDPHIPGGANVSAEANVPDPKSFFGYAFGDTWYTHGNYEDPDAGDISYAAGLMHEFGHAVGLAHGHAAQTIIYADSTDIKPVLPADHDSQEYSVMTYRRYAGGPTTGLNNADYPQSLMQDDIAALQYLYGPDFNYRAGNTVYSWNPTTGQMSLNGIAANVPDDNHIFMTVWDGGGVDTYDFSNYTTNLIVNLNPGAWTTVDANQLAFLGADDGVNHFARGNIANALLYRGNFGSAIENAIGGTGNDRLTGNALDNTLTAGVGNDTLVGAGGVDRFEGGAGRDSIDGGLGIDQAQYTFASAGVTVDLLFSPLNTGEAAGDTFDSVENLRGSIFNDILRGDDGANGIGGWIGGGSDTLVGRGGNDSLAGGDGDDLLFGDTGSDSLDGGDGRDTASYASAASRVVADLLFEFRFTAEGDAFGDSYLSIENLSGSSFNDDLRGDAVGNFLSGGNGADGFNGRGGVDTLLGGGGNDLFFLEDLAFTQIAGFRYDTVTEAAGGGIDTVIVTAIDNPDTISTERYSLGANVENGQVRGTLAFNLTGNELRNYLTGNSAANKLTGNQGDDSLDGGAGFDTLVGGVGNDAYILGDLPFTQISGFRYDTVTEAVDGGIDTAFVTAIDNPDTISTERYTLGANVENGQVRGTLAFNLTGNELRNYLTGNSAANALTGNQGNDSLDGGAGFDTLVGGVGNDTYILGDLAFTQISGFRYDTLTEAVDGGIDTAFVAAIDNPDTISTERYTLGANVENGQITGTLAFNLFGNEIGNRLTGNVAANILSGGLGNDLLSGGDGLDSLTGGAGRDSFAFMTALSSSSVDIVRDFAHVEDTIRLSQAVFTAFSGQAANTPLAAGALADFAAPAEADHRILFRHLDGGDADTERDQVVLYYDPTGGNRSDAVLFARLSDQASVTLTASDFLIVA